MPRICRTKHFAEAQIMWREVRWLLCAPLTDEALRSVERNAAYLGRLRSGAIPEYRLLRHELRYRDSAGGEHTASLVLQRLPAGRTLADVLGAAAPCALLPALDLLQRELQRLKVTHNNLRPENIVLNRGRLIPIRYYYARTDGTGDDSTAFETLRQLLRALPASEPQPVAPFVDSTDRFPGHRWVGRTFEQLTCVADDNDLYGYVDAENRTVIAPRFRWADDFREGRAAVETETGMGLIDKQGCYVIDPRYEIVEYDAATGESQVRSQGLWARFDYLGHQLTAFTGEYDLQ